MTAKDIYRQLLRLYPPGFREEYAAPLEQQFHDEYREKRGWFSRAVFWMGALADLAWSIPSQMLRETRQDLGYARRVYRRQPLVATLALAALAVAIGAATGVFGVVDALLLRSLPFRDPERVVQLYHYIPSSAFAGPNGFHAWRQTCRYLEDAAVYSPSELSLALGGEAVRIRAAETSYNFLTLLGGQPEIGRPFLEGEDQPGREGVAIISHALWQQSFGADPRILGSKIHLNGVPFTLVGVAPVLFDYPAGTAVWTNTVFEPKRIPRAGMYYWEAIGRLRPDMSLGQANRGFDADVGREQPNLLKADDANRPRLLSLRATLVGPVGKASLVLMGAVGFVLLIACANVGQLLLSRVSERRQEMVVRAALGASRARLVRQLVTESVALTLAASLAGLIVAHWATRVASAVQPPAIDAQRYTILDWRVLAFAVGMAAVTGLLFGVLPARLISGIRPANDPGGSIAGAGGAGASRMRIALVAWQAALAVVLLAGSIGMGRSFLNLLGTDLGFRTGGIATLSVSLTGTRYLADGRQNHYFREVLDRLRAIPGIESAGGVQYLPLQSNVLMMATAFSLGDGQQEQAATVISATPGYFGSIGAKVLHGREFNDADRSGSEAVAIVSDDLARRLTDGAPIVGRKLMSQNRANPVTVVGVVQSLRLAGPAYGGGPQVFVPSEQSPPDFMTFVVKVRGKPEPYLAVCRDVARRVDPQAAVHGVKTLDESLTEILARPRFYTTVILFFGLFSMLLAGIGVYGVATSAVARRTHELGVRMAVGASVDRLRRTLLAQGLLPVVAGAAAGVVGAAATGKLLQYLSDTAEPAPLTVCIAAALLLVATAATAVWTASRRILRVDPIQALRSD